MSSSVIEKSLSTPPDASWSQRIVSFGWLTILVGALAMAATYPGRSQGLGLVTRPMLDDLQLGDADGLVFNGKLVFWGTMIGSLFCLPIGWLFERCDRRLILAGNLILLGLSVIWMSTVQTWFELFVALILTRGLGQSALSVVSITIVAKSFNARQLGIAMACYSIAATPFYILMTQSIGWATTVARFDWRLVWGTLGLTIMTLSAMSCLLSRRPKIDREQGLTPLASDETAAASPARGATLRQALLSPAFWVFSLTVSFWGMISAGVSQYNVHILSELGFRESLYKDLLTVIIAVALVSQLVFGRLTNYMRMTHLLAICLLSTAVALVQLPYATEEWHVYLYGVVMGVGSGAVALIFFAAYGKLYGRRDLGRIQGIAQMLTVFASAAGPWAVAESFRATGSHVNFFHTMAAAVFVMAVIAVFTPQPRLEDSTEQAT